MKGGGIGLSRERVREMGMTYSETG